MMKKIKLLAKRVIRFVHTERAKKRVNSYELPLHVNKKCMFTGSTFLGKNTHFNGMNILGAGKVVISDNFHSGPECLIITSDHNYNGTSLPYDNTFINKNVYIGENVWLGARVIILGGVTLGEGVIIQAGSVVVSDIPSYSIAGGHPAKVFSQRDIFHYKDVKAQRSFC